MNAPKKSAKEGSKSEKLIHEQNISTLRFYRYLILVTLIVHAVIIYTVHWSTFTKRYISLTTLASALCVGAYKFMSYMSTPSYGPNDRGVLQLQDAGLDLNIGKGGIAEHAKDTIILCCIVLLSSLIHRYLWILLFAIPLRLFNMLWVNLLAPWIFDPGQEPQVNEKKQLKMERRMRRVGHLTK